MLIGLLVGLPIVGAVTDLQRGEDQQEESQVDSGLLIDEGDSSHFADAIENQKRRQSVDEKDIQLALESAIEVNPDTCAWLYVPNTNVSIAVMRHADDDAYYFSRDSDGNPRSVGAVYMESLNSADFTDSVTVLYGHSFSDANILFTDLHRLENARTFNDTERFFVYLPDSILTYKIIGACQYDDSHILSGLNLNRTDDIQAYFDDVTDNDPETFAGYKRRVERLDAKRDRIVQLSTCTLPAADGVRFVVTGLLVSEKAL